MTQIELSEDEVRLAEAHRGFVREMDSKLGKAYGMGGAAVVGVMIAVVVLGWVLGMLTQASLWILGATTALFALYMARRRIYSLRDRMRVRVERYCEVNDLQARILHEYYQSENMYPFFAAIFEERPQRISADRPATEH